MTLSKNKAKRNWKKEPLLDKGEKLLYEDNIPEGWKIDSKEIIGLFIELYGRECLEKCSDLYEGEYGSPGGEGSISSSSTRDL